MLAVKRPPGGMGDDSGVVSNQEKDIFERGTTVMGSNEDVFFPNVEAFWFY
jgi:hypothetical protein